MWNQICKKREQGDLISLFILNKLCTLSPVDFHSPNESPTVPVDDLERKDNIIFQNFLPSAEDFKIAETFLVISSSPSPT